MALRAPSPNAQRAMVALLAFAGLPLTLGSQTFTATSGMPVRIEIIASCTVSASDLDFGSYNPSSGTPVLGQTTVQLDCSVGAVAEVSLDAGTGPGGNTTRRRLDAESGGPDQLAYDLYQDAARTIHWGDKSGVDTREVLATGGPQLLPVYGAIPGGQQVGAGTYSDVITVQVLY